VFEGRVGIEDLCCRVSRRWVCLFQFLLFIELLLCVHFCLSRHLLLAHSPKGPRHLRQGWHRELYAKELSAEELEVVVSGLDSRIVTERAKSWWWLGVGTRDYKGRRPETVAGILQWANMGLRSAAAESNGGEVWVRYGMG
jgi:hypothetical protein